jgi:hypothetical protein
MLTRKMPYVRFGYAVTALLAPKVATFSTHWRSWLWVSGGARSCRS